MLCSDSSYLSALSSMCCAAVLLWYSVVQYRTPTIKKKTSNKKGMLIFTGKQEMREPLYWSQWRTPPFSNKKYSLEQLSYFLLSRRCPLAVPQLCTRYKYKYAVLPPDPSWVYELPKFELVYWCKQHDRISASLLRVEHRYLVPGVMMPQTLCY